MITVGRGNLLESKVDALVNTVNCVGHMGKGIALQFKQAFPANYNAYKKACDRGEVVPGRMFVFDNGGLLTPHFIINFPTKRHWRGKSRIEDIDSGLEDLVRHIERLGIRSIAIPPLGCGHGGLNWPVVRNKIEQALEALPDVEVLLFEPTGAPDFKSMPVRTERPHMTPSRALFIQLMESYGALDYSRTLLEVQKLAYLLQVIGEPLKLRYEPGHYGPYANNVNKVLEAMEGHFIRGYGDSQKPDTQIEILPKATEEASAFLENRTDSLDRLARVATLIEGFETPYGMELLTSVHWVASQGGPGYQEPAESPDAATRQIHAWNERKRKIFKPEHIGIAWQRLQDCGWLQHHSSSTNRPT